jgi:hypothetical protein
MDARLYDKVCDKHFSSQSALNKHLKSGSHLKQIKLNELKEANQNSNEEDIKKELKKSVQKNYYCPLCDFKTKNKEDLYNHLATDRHKDNLSLYKYNMKNIGKLDLYELFDKEIYDGDIYIGVFKGKEHTKEDIIKKFDIDLKGERKNTVLMTERAKYGEIKKQKENQPKNYEKIKKLEDLILTIEISYKRYLKKVEKYNKEGGLNPELRPGTKRLKEQYADIDELKQKLEKMKK